MAQSFPVIMRYCTCTDSTGSLTPLGHRQQEYEDLIRQNHRPSEVLDRMGLRRMCCRNTFLNPPHLFLMDANTGRFRDTTGLLNQHTGGFINRDVVTTINGPIIEPKKKLPDLPSIS